jgi:hypothetical protein
LVGPAFFLSYARARSQPRPVGRQSDVNERPRRLFDDLVDRVAQLLPLPAGHDVGFMDRSLEAGTRWSDVVLHNVATCHVFVALLSDRYLHESKWCSMEWDLFARRPVKRLQTSGRDSGTAILPIVWAPTTRPTPARVSAIERFIPHDLSEEHRVLYQRQGVLGLCDLDEQAYRAVVWMIARQIQIIYSSFEVEPVQRPTTAGLRRSFQKGKP